ncbi:MAG: imidazole glycerol phosphate synthase subunit HisH [Candidatus Altiarchaeota archaeon]|nr:imidazole glycerol phosphate synthase subunit HisH [Candidatus Altiarchaeota archaeon]
MIALIDYGAGNLKSISNACGKLGEKVELVTKADQLEKANKIILPGVGNFGPAMKSLEGFREVLLEKIEKGVPFLGLCLGIQVILEGSEESPGVRGLGIIKGTCKRFPSSVKIPHMGWNSIKPGESKLLGGIKPGDYFYFVHSYYPVPEGNVVAATTDYGVEFPSVIERDSVFATQFHPEKSGEPGLRVLKNFLEI